MSILIQLSGVGKKYNNEWIFKNISCEFHSGQRIAILGANGSGKSTLLQLLSGFVSPTEGSYSFHENQVKSTEEDLYKRMALSSPYMELIEDFTLEELIAHHSLFKPFVREFNIRNFISDSGLRSTEGKLIKYFSSGMKQRVKLAMALYADVPLVLLDEPASNLDRKGIDWYRSLVMSQKENKIIVVASNRLTDEFDFCETILNIEEYKK